MPMTLLWKWLRYCLRCSRLKLVWWSRIAIARAILKNAPILILGQVHLIMNLSILFSKHLMARSYNDCDCASFINNWKCIVVLDRGQIVEQGTHQELDRVLIINYISAILRTTKLAQLIQNAWNKQSNWLVVHYHVCIVLGFYWIVIFTIKKNLWRACTGHGDWKYYGSGKTPLLIELVNYLKQQK